MTNHRPTILPALAFALTVAIGSTPQAGAHHGWSGYVRLEAPGKTWLVVLAPPSRMENRGLARAALSPGKTVTVVGYPNRTDPQEMRAERITVDGKTTELR